jgi:hypothetical protein
MPTLQLIKLWWAMPTLQLILGVGMGGHQRRVGIAHQMKVTVCWVMVGNAHPTTNQVMVGNAHPTTNQGIAHQNHGNSMLGYGGQCPPYN